MMAGVRLERITFEDVRGARAVLPKIGGARLLRSVLRILGRNDLCSIATLASGRPYINTAYFSCSAELVREVLGGARPSGCMARTFQHIDAGTRSWRRVRLAASTGSTA